MMNRFSCRSIAAEIVNLAVLFKGRKSFIVLFEKIKKIFDFLIILFLLCLRNVSKWQQRGWVEKHCRIKKSLDKIVGWIFSLVCYGFIDMNIVCERSWKTIGAMLWRESFRVVNEMKLNCFDVSFRFKYSREQNKVTGSTELLMKLLLCVYFQLYLLYCFGNGYEIRNTSS